MKYHSILTARAMLQLLAAEHLVHADHFKRRQIWEDSLRSFQSFQFLLILVTAENEGEKKRGKKKEEKKRKEEEEEIAEEEEKEV